MGTMIGTPEIKDSVFDKIKGSPYNTDETRWAAYQNHEIGHPDLGHLQFLAVGRWNTFKHPPQRLPDSPNGVGWRYVFVGFLNLKTKQIEEVSWHDTQP